jgi:hypothetical protein
VTIERDGKTVVRILQLPPEIAEAAPFDVSPNDIDVEPFVQSVSARHAWVLGRLFERKGNIELAALCYTEIRRLYPRSEY